jgi:hypothetical protein
MARARITAKTTAPPIAMSPAGNPIEPTDSANNREVNRVATGANGEGIDGFPNRPPGVGPGLTILKARRRRLATDFGGGGF